MILGETHNEKRNRKAQLDDAARAARQMSELTGERLEFLDEFTYDPRWVLGLPNCGLDRRPKCCKPKPPKPKEKK